MASAASTSEHLRRVLLGAATAVIGLVERGSPDGFARVVERHPFLAEYARAIAESVPRGLDWDASLAWWIKDLEAWEARHLHLPLLRLDSLSSGRERLAYGIAALPHEDLRWGGIARQLQAPFDALSMAPQTIAAALDGPGDRSTLRLIDRLTDRGVLVSVDAASSTRGVEVSMPLWRLVRDQEDDAWTTRRGDPAALAHWEPTRRDDLLNACKALIDGRYDTLVVRSVPGSDASSALDAAFGVVERPVFWSEDANIKSGAALAASIVLGAVPAVQLELSAGTNAASPRPAWYHGPLVLLTGRSGGLVPGEDRRLRLGIDRSARAERERFWAEVRPRPTVAPENLAATFGLPDGHLRRIAADATVRAKVDGRRAPRTSDLRDAADEIGQHALETHAARLPTSHLGWDDLVVGAPVAEDLKKLATRCRLREHLGATEIRRGAIGVRALMLGPSGVGKTLAASVLAADIDKCVYRVDMSAIFDKFVGETEKNLDAVLAAAEQLDCVLLVDEGDTLLGSRTEGSTANDRYANLETNFLLQRLEEYIGIIVVTSNAGDRIDTAFARRMDATITFARPQVTQRRQIWELHLPDGHQVEASELDDLARSHRLTGAQIKNAVLFARMLALDSDLDLDHRLAEEGVLAEYRKVGRLPRTESKAIERAANRREGFTKQLIDQATSRL